jgi:hypothetical protein
VTMTISPGISIIFTSIRSNMGMRRVCKTGLIPRCRWVRLRSYPEDWAGPAGDEAHSFGER